MAPRAPGALLGVAILGTGQVATRHAEAIRELPGVALRAVADVNDARRAAWIGRHAPPDTAEFGDYRQVLDRDDVDLVVVTLPHRLHCEAVVAAAGAGKHVLVEKPMALSVNECDRMIAAARTAGTVLAVGLTYHFRSVSVRAKELLDSGAFGRIAWATETAYAPWAYNTQRDWLFDRERGGGQLLANGVHYVDRLLWTMAGPTDTAAPARLVRGRPVTISASLGIHFHDGEPLVRADDGVVLFLRLDSGQTATVHLAGHSHGLVSYAAEYVCARGQLRYTWDRLYTTDPASPAARDYREVDTERRLGFAAQLADVADAIRSGRSPAVPGEWGRLVTRVLAAAEESAARGQEVTVDVPQPNT